MTNTNFDVTPARDEGAVLRKELSFRIVNVNGNQELHLADEQGAERVVVAVPDAIDGGLPLALKRAVGYHLTDSVKKDLSSPMSVDYSVIDSSSGKVYRGRM